MNEQIKKGILEGRVILFLGAGASFGSKNKNHETPPLGTDLAKKIASKAGWSYQNEKLGVVYSAARKILGPELDNLLIDEYKKCIPSEDYCTLAKYPWARIYTTNIDDAFETALTQNSRQNLNIKNRNDRIEDKDQLLLRLEYIYLNGSVKTPDLGYVFSPEEYGKASANSPQWYEEVASDFLQCVFIFVGSDLDEPVLYHQIERYKKRAGISAPLSYVLTPSATPIQIASLDSYGLSHISSTLNDFCSWLTSELEFTPEPLDIAKLKFPELKNYLGKNNANLDDKAISLLSSITLVSRQSLGAAFKTQNPGTIRSFYKGFKPDWGDIIDAIPAKLAHFDKFLSTIISVKYSECKLVALVGAAGSGKSTLLKMAALDLADTGEKVYFISSVSNDVVNTVKELEKSNDKDFYIFIERADPIKNEIKKIIDIVSNATLVTSESQNIWHNRLAQKFCRSEVCTFVISDIVEGDVLPILEKIKKYGPWTRLAKMSERERKRELFDRSKRQLLIGLMEATTGIGFEQIIQNEYVGIVSESDRLFFVIACIATMHKCNLSLSMISRSLSSANINESPYVICSRLKGIIEEKNANYIVRHPIYARRIIESVVDKELIECAIESLLDGFKVYTHPIVKNLNRNDASLFKHIINHRFLLDVLRSDEEKIDKIYSDQEKFFENDGLFWLQYGLYKRSLKKHTEAYELLQTAYSAYPHDHSVHALAQQKMILASSGVVSTEQARNHLSDAIKLFEKLDDTLESDDTYPIVALAEGHVASLIKLDGDIPARIKAKEYIGRIDNRLRNNKNKRLQESKEKLFRFATTGTWKETV